MKKLFITFILFFIITNTSYAIENNTEITDTMGSSYSYKKNPYQYWYVGGGLGYLVKDFVYGGNSAYTPFASNSPSNTDLSAFVGYNFTNWYALEADIVYGIPNTTTYSDHTEKANFAGIFLSNVFTGHFDKHNAIFFKEGLGFAEFNYHNSNPQYNNTPPVLDYNHEVLYNYALYLALGYEYNINKQNALSLSYNFYTTFLHNESRRDGITYENTDNNFAILTADIQLQYKYSFN